MRRSIRTALAWLVLAAPSFADDAAADRTLHWRALDVRARLDAGGLLHVVETHSIVFNGYWNGAERTFHLRNGQTVALRSLSEIGANGERISFDEQSLDSIHSWAWHAPGVLRWRARATTDPPFDHAMRTYVLTYTMSNIVMRREDRYRISHDFAFPGRVGMIERFTLRFELDPAWIPLVDFDRTAAVENLPPGQSYVLSLPLRHDGSATPSARDLTQPIEPASRPVAEPASPLVRATIGAIVVLALVALLASFLLLERAHGRFIPLDPPSVIDRAWLDTNLFSMRPEVAGAAWDEKTGAAEVAALLARLALEGKIATRVEQRKEFLWHRPILHLEKTSDFNELERHERNLLEKLFFGAEKTDTDRVRKKYAKRGFDPAATIVRSIAASLPWPKPKEDPPPEWRWLALGTAGGLLYALAVAGVWYFSSVDDAMILFGWGFAAAIFAPLLALFASISRRHVAHPFAALLTFLLPAAFFFYLAARLFFLPADIRAPAAVSLGFLLVLMLAVILTAASTTGEEKKVAVRKKLLAARRYLAEELKKREPALDDSWFPYLLAFGLGGKVDRWFRAFRPPGAAESVGSGFGRSNFTASSSGHSVNIWTGGGSSFGGAGASGSWSVAATGIGSAISSPRSSSGSSGGRSSSGGSSSSSGGSSGGGGGGGW